MYSSSKSPQRHSFRLKGYDYSASGAYFITICTRVKTPYFERYPELKDIVQSEWKSLPDRFSTLKPDAFIVMPNHIHAILFLDKAPEQVEPGAVGPTAEVARGQAQALPLRSDKFSSSSPTPTVGTIIGAFKSLCMNKWAKYRLENNTDLKESIWQRNYYEHIIRDETELNQIREYVIFNPNKWTFDRNNPGYIHDQQYQLKWDWLEHLDGSAN